MNYPVWYLPETGGGFLIALIAILHVFVSHFAVGGGLYLIYAEKKGLKEKSEAILDFTKKHARFFILVTMVFGSITGVGIWFIIALVNPAGTSILIHNFVFGWAAEWVFFVVEIVAAFVYFYMFGKMDSATHLKIGWVYFIAAWVSLLLINGIIGCMLTPGAWVENNDFWVGFFNPSFLPSLFFRTFIALMIAACYGYLTASFTVNEEIRVAMTRFSAKWALVSLVAAIPFGFWYISILPDSAQSLVMGKSPTISMLLPFGAAGIIALLAVMLGAGIIKPALNLKPIACIALVSALAVIGTFEWVREAARRPYVINEVMYSNSIFKSDVGRINQDGYLQSAIWVENKEINGENSISAGEELFINQCYACHTVNGSNNGIFDSTKNMSFRALQSYISKIHEKRYFMPPFAGTGEEISALASFIAGGLHGKDISSPAATGGINNKGRLVFEDSCSSCHQVEELAEPFAGVDQEGISEMLATLDEISDEMEPFSGTENEKKELVGFLNSLNNKGGEAVPLGQAGTLTFEDNCSACHQLEDVTPAFEGIQTAEALQILRTLNEISDEMEPFSGTDAETEQFGEFLTIMANEPETLKEGGE